MLRLPLVFGRAHADITLSEGGVATTTAVNQGGWHTAVTKVVSGRGVTSHSSRWLRATACCLA